ncbi:hypothetical protein Tco_0528156 [Tanacetum coccineum]
MRSRGAPPLLAAQRPDLRDRRTHAHTPQLWQDQMLGLSREAWGQAMDASEILCHMRGYILRTSSACADGEETAEIQSAYLKEQRALQICWRQPARGRKRYTTERDDSTPGTSHHTAGAGDSLTGTGDDIAGAGYCIAGTAGTRWGPSTARLPEDTGSAFLD